MRAQTLFLISLGAALIVPALAIHIGGVVAYLGAAGTFAGLAVLWRNLTHQEREVGSTTAWDDVLNVAASALRRRQEQQADQDQAPR